jgi:predicted nuclease with TOPRIM domain
MSSLLEQAIIDATALKEAALKNAEAQVLERYSTDVKEALKNLLEQEEGFTEPSATEPTGTGTSATGMGGDQAMGGGANIKNQAPSAFRDGQKLCACPEDKEQVTIDLNLSDIEDMASEAGIPVGGNMPNPATLGPTPSAQSAGLQEEYEVNKDELLDLYEKLTVDARNVPYGNIEYPANSLEVEYAKDISLAKKAQLEAEQEASEVVQENNKLTKENKILARKLDSVQNKLAKISEIAEALANRVEEYESAVSTLKERLDTITVSNAKLLYKNKVLNSNSLNERQKSKIVEALSNAESADEAKTIYQTLQSTVSSDNKVAAPKSLSEAINRTSSIIMQTRQNDAPPPVIERMQRLAGIKNK